MSHSTIPDIYLVIINYQISTFSNFPIFVDNLRSLLQLLLQLLYLSTQPNVLLKQTLVHLSPWIIEIVAGRLTRVSTFFFVLVLLMIEEFVVHIAFLNLRATLHKSLYTLVNIFFFPHYLKLLLNTFSTRKTSKIKISVILNQILRIT
jgi:hypothetical protein